MRWVTWIDDEKATVEIVSRDGDTVVATIESASGKREVRCDVRAAGNGERFVRRADGTGEAAWVGPATADGRVVDLARGHVSVKVKRELDAWLAAGDDAAGSGAVTVAMPGRVVKVLAQVGDAVVKGQPVLIIEAMKMENEVKTRRAGHVRVLHVKEGDSVEGGKVLMEVGD